MNGDATGRSTTTTRSLEFESVKEIRRAQEKVRNLGMGAGQGRVACDETRLG